MTLALIFTTAALLAAVGALVALTARRQLPGPSLKGATVVLTVGEGASEQTVRGVVLADHADRLTLHQALYVTPLGEQAAAGLVHVYRPLGAVQQIEG